MKRVLITGGSEGIGLALAECFGRDGWEVLLCARNAEKLAAAEQYLKETCHTDVRVFVHDLCREGEAEALLQEAGDIDVLVNNAGMGYTGAVIEADPEHEKKLVRLNCEAVMVLSMLEMKQMVRKGSGEIINIASTGAFQPGPYIASYYASKAFVLSYTRALAEEAEGTGVRVYCYCPGPVHTAFYAKYGGKPNGPKFTPQMAASYLYTHRGKQTVIVPGALNRLMRLLPVTVRMKAIRAMKQNPKK